MSDASHPDQLKHHVGIIGGGITGLTAAYRLSKLGHHVTLWERSSDLGGLASAFQVPGGHLERFYHHLFMSDQAIVKLIQELGIAEHLVWLESQNSYFSKGKAYSLASPLDLLRLPIIPFIDRIRVGLVTLYLQQITPESGRWKKFESITAWEWLRRYIGERAFSSMFGAQLRAKFGSRAEEISMAWFWNKVYLRTQSRPGLFGREKLGYIMGSFNTLIDALVGAARANGVSIRSRTPVTSIDRQKESHAFDITEENGQSTSVDSLIVTTPAPIFLQLFPEVADPYRAQLLNTTYQGAVCIIFRLDRQLSNSYWLNNADTSLPFTVVVEHTNFIPAANYDGNHYLYVNTYVDWDHPYVEMSDTDLVQEYASYLSTINPNFERSWIQEHWIFKARAAQPIIGLQYGSTIPEHRTPIPGVYLATMSQIYPEDRGTNYAVELGNSIASIAHNDSLSQQP